MMSFSCLPLQHYPCRVLSGAQLMFPCSHMVLSLVPEGPSVKHKLRVTTKKKKSNNQSRFKLSVALWPIFFLTVCLN